MNLSCIHCGNEFSITANQLGGRGRCPHCQGEIQLPKADTDNATEQLEYQPTNWLENSMSALGTFVIHLVLFIVLAFISFGSQGLDGQAEDVFIGDLPGTELNSTQEEGLKSDQVDKEQDSEELNDPVNEVEAPSDPSDDGALEMASLQTPKLSSGPSGDFSTATVSIGGGAGGDSWNKLIPQLKRNGLDIVIVFDSTGSMGGEIDVVKRQVKQIGGVLTKLIPKARISLCTYRDAGDEYVVKGLPLTNDVQRIDTYLSEVFASGGGDHPEGVHEGLKWAVEKNKFRTRARKVILLFGDAPPHSQHLRTCLEIASDFSSQQKGIVSTVTCRSPIKLKEFVDIAQAGGGEAFLTSDERQIMTRLMVLVFGSKYRDKVIEAFKLLDK